MESVFKPTLVLMSGRMVSLGATLFIPVVLARVLTVEEFGTYKQVFLIHMTLYAIAQFGMAESLFYFLPRTSQRAGRYVLNSILLLLLAASVCSGILLWEGARVSDLLGNSRLAQYFPLLGMYLVFMTASAALEIVMISRQQYKRAAYSYAGSDVLRTVLLLSPALLLRSVQGLLVGAVVFALCRFLVMVFYLRREFRNDLAPDRPLLKQQLSYALPFQCAIVIETIQANFHQYAVSHYFGAVTFAIYAIGCLQIPLVELFASPAGNVMMVKMSGEIQNGRTDSAVEVWRETTRKLSLLLFPLFGLALASAHEVIVLLFSAQYSASVPIFMVWSGTILLATLQTDSALRVYAQTRLLAALNVLRLVVIVGLIYTFLSIFGLIGAVLLTLLATCVYKALSLMRLRGLMGVRMTALLPWKSLSCVGGASALALMSSMVAHALPGLSIISRLLVIGIIYMSVYGLLIFRLGILTSAEKLSIHRWTRNVLAIGGNAKTSHNRTKEEEQCVALSEY